MFSKYIKEYNIPNKNSLQVNIFIKHAVKIIKQKILKYFHNFGSIKILINCKVQFIKQTDHETKFETNYFSVNAYHITALNFVNEVILNIFEEFYIKFDSFTTKGSGWSIHSLEAINLIIFILNKY